ncbi:hypothetical protein PMAYCL1PPCAC_06929 [Pristionchus mayeri]|uniref:Uncharacterized protein n=1 Tax=Pristionchus mayeri TaxID=1317129 RepID=A0AAN4ZBS7_9BILA|nr:hypothetical protein PMAYCL1PPCAC_06929 [Pristionchus mayeri]
MPSLHRLLLLFLHIPLSTSFVVNSNPCRVDSSSSSLSSCSCLPDDDSIVIECNGARLGGIPSLPPDTPITLRIQGENLHTIGPDSFGTADILSLHLSHNGLRSISANAFRGLEDSLRTLRVSSNNLTELPTWSFALLSQLETLDLSSNRISLIRNKAFDETTLTSLRFLYLDDNQIEVIPTRSLRNLRCLVLSLSSNRLVSLEKLSLPSTLTIIDLTANLLSEIPYLALAEQPDLKEINLEGNRIFKTDFNPEIMISSEIKLILRNNRIAYLNEDSFRSFRKFTTLDLSYNEIDAVSPHIFSTVSSVKELNLSHNRVTSLGRGTFENIGKALKTLNLGWNEMHTVPEALADLRVLQVLRLDGNKLSKLDVAPLTALKDSLEELSLSYNHLSSLPSLLLQSMTSLKVLDLSKNRIDSVSASWRIGNLEKLYLAANRLSSLSSPPFFAHSPSLSLLDLSSNLIHSLSPSAFSTLLSIDTLFLQHNQLKMIPREALIAQTSLHTLILDSNLIETLPTQSTAPWPRLSRLFLSSNRISSIDDRSFSSSFSLRYLDLSKNRIPTIKSHTFELLRLSTLLLSHNDLKQLHPMWLAHISDMRRLDLSHNSLRLLPSRCLFNVSSLDHLLLSHNQLEHLESDALYEVRRIGHLDLSHNRLKLFSCSIFTSLPRVDVLDLSHNALSSVELSCLKSSLHRLSLSHNQLQTVEEDLLEGAHSLSSLSLSHNQLLSIHSAAFSSVPSLSSIHLSHNHLRLIRKGTFSHQRSLSLLDLSHNALVSLHPQVLGTNNVNELRLNANQLVSIPVEGIRSASDSLSSLHLSDNSITSVDALQFVNLSNLRTLVLAGNRIHSLEEEAFSSLSRLEYLDLSRNPFSSWHPNSFKALSEGILSVNLASTGLFSIPKFDSPELVSLDFSSNKITEMDSSQLDSLPRLRSLNLSSNSLSTLHDRLFTNLSTLETLDLSSNPLHSFSDTHLTQLHRLKSLSLNNLPSLLSLPNPRSFTQLSSLQSLELTHLPLGVTNYNLSALLSSLPPLHRLAIQINDPILLDELSLADLRFLRSLSITGDRLVEIGTGSLRGLRGFDFDLSITRTNITSFQPAIFDTLTSIQRLSLNLDNNLISFLNPFTYTPSPILNRQATVLQSISLRGNPIVCDCRMDWLIDWPLAGDPCPQRVPLSLQEREVCNGSISVPFLSSLVLLLLHFFFP